MYDIEKRSAVPKNVAGFVRQDAYMYGPVTKWQHWGNKLRVPPNTVRVGMPPVLSS